MSITVASGNKSTRDAIAMLIRIQPDLELAGEAKDVADLLAITKGETTQTPLIVLDWDELGQRVETLMDLLELFADRPQIVALSVREEVRGEAHSVGIRNFAHKRDSPDRLLATLRASKSSDATEIRRGN